ncbi:MAG: hypothetical protein L6N95_01220 [Candidatus Methylarchaceae archaeon HK01B]|nr:hypothetical protein [Candidatus Methylarchaceae archaeon HK02M1]MCP8318434.1 hypothetical protein [Candidatus Methylarchaceae archaeon HK01B]
MSKEDEIELIFLPERQRLEGLRKVGYGEAADKFAAKVSDIIKWFKGFKVESVELWIEGGIKEGGITKLFISFEGKGGCKVTLKPVKS